MEWRWKEFDGLTTGELYELLRLRAEVFVVEQNCVYQDLDGVDRRCAHLLGWEKGQLLAALRFVPAGVKYAEASIGRVVTAPPARGRGLGRELMREALARVGKEPLRISAQAYLERFYAGFRFRRVGENYLEDGIPHCEMLREP